MSQRAFLRLSEDLRDTIWLCNIAPKDVKKEFTLDDLWSQILYAWSHINFSTPANRTDILRQVIWKNSFIKNDQHTICWCSWIQKNIIFLEDIVKENGTFKSAIELNVNWLELERLKSSISKNWKEILTTSTGLDPNSESVSLYNQLFGIE